MGIAENLQSMAQEWMQGMREIYSSLEGKYYDFLDKVDEKIPIYRIIDPIDKVVPSFALLLLLIFLAIVLLLASAVFLAIMQPSALFRVQDGKGNPLSGIEAVVENSAGAGTFTTDAFGEFRVAMGEGEADVSIDTEGYKPYSATIQVSLAEPNIITLRSGTVLLEGEKTITVKIRDSAGQAIKSLVNLRFSCSYGTAPRGRTTSTGSASIDVELSCGTLTTEASAYGYENGRSSDNVQATDTVIIAMNGTSTSTGSLRAEVFDADSGERLPGVTLKLYKESEYGTSATLMETAETDSSGVNVFEGLYAGTYYVGAQDMSEEYISADSGSVTVISGRQADVQIGMRKRAEQDSEAEKLLLQFVGADSSEPVEGVLVSLFNGDVFETAEETDFEGIVEFRNLDNADEYSIVAEHADYLTKALMNLELVPKTSNDPMVIELTPATESNAGTANVSVKDYLGNPQYSATVYLYDAQFEFYVGSGTADSAGNAEFTNLPAGTYYAYAEKGALEGVSDDERLDSGGTIALYVTLGNAMGGIRAIVTDKGGAPIEGAAVEFFDEASGGKLGDAQTGADGLTEALTLPIETKPYLRIEKEGYLPYTTIAYTLKVDETIDALVVLEKGAADFRDGALEISLMDVLDETMQQADVISPGSTYYFMFNLRVSDNFENADALVRAGLQEQVNEEDSVIVITGVERSNASATLSACYNAADNYADCEITEGEAKQARLSYGTLERGTYEFMAKAHIRDVPEEGRAGTVIELRYGAKGTYGGREIYMPNSRDLYYASYKFGPISRGKGKLIYELTLEDPTGEYYPEPVEAGKKTLTLPLGENFILHYKITNTTAEDFRNVKISAVNTDTALELGYAERDLGFLGRGTSLSDTLGFKTAKDSAAAVLKLSLNLNRNDASASAKFKVLPAGKMNVSLSPGKLVPNLSTTVTVFVSDASGGAPIKGAYISVKRIEGSTETPLPSLTAENGGMADDAGKYSIWFPAYDYDEQNPAKFRVIARKRGYVDASAEIALEPLPPPEKGFETGLSCVEITPQSGKCTRGGKGEFTIMNRNCKAVVEIALGKAAAGDISAEPALEEAFELADAQSKKVTVTSNEYLGIHPVFVYANFKGSAEQAWVATFELIVTQMGTCLEIADNKFTYDLLQGDNKGTAKNMCYSGYYDARAEGASEGETAGYYPNVETPDEKGLVFRVSEPRDCTGSGGAIKGCSLFDYMMINRGMKGEQYVLMNVEDYRTG
ncbi:MAG: SpaA isopeptide-forming pilin-related protein [Candidatus Diapherotrites archaeon]